MAWSTAIAAYSFALSAKARSWGVNPLTSRGVASCAWPGGVNLANTDAAAPGVSNARVIAESHVVVALTSA